MSQGNLKGIVKVTGSAELTVALNLAGEQIKRNVLRSAFGKAARVAAKRAKTAARTAFNQRTGLLLKAIRSGTTKSRAEKLPMGRVRVDKKIVGAQNGKKVWPVKYAHLVEFGTKWTRSAHPFLLDAFNDSSVMNTLTAEARRKFKQIIKSKYMG